MRDDARAELEARGLIEAYDRRPFYQRNDYLARIGRAKLLETPQKRIGRMLDELDRGGVYMGKDHPPSRKL
jgi:hypothetical protein